MKNTISLMLLIVLCSSCSTTYYYVVRHAERLNGSTNSPLSEAGLKRAEVLKDSLSNIGIDSIYATTFIRTQQTVQPLAASLHQSTIIYNPNNTDSIVAVLKKINGKKLVIAGHSDTVPEIVSGLSGKPVAAIAATDFDNLYLVIVRRGLCSKKWLYHKTYGQPTE